jgi:hypothetical protein
LKRSWLGSRRAMRLGVLQRTQAFEVFRAGLFRGLAIHRVVQPVRQRPTDQMNGVVTADAALEKSAKRLARFVRVVQRNLRLGHQMHEHMQTHVGDRRMVFQRLAVVRSDAVLPLVFVELEPVRGIGSALGVVPKAGVVFHLPRLTSFARPARPSIERLSRVAAEH